MATLATGGVAASAVTANASVSPNGSVDVVSVVAGGSDHSYIGDDGPATAAGLNDPQAVLATSDGGYLIADSGHHAIRAVDASGTITTVVDTGLTTPTALAQDAAGDIYVGDDLSNSNAALKEVSSGVVSTLYTFSDSPHPEQINGIAVDGSGNIYVSLQSECEVVELTSGGSLVGTIAGDGTCSYVDSGTADTSPIDRPRQIALDGRDLYISESYGCDVKEVDLGTGDMTTVVGQAGDCDSSGDGGPATSATIYYPDGLAVDSEGDIFVEEGEFPEVREITSFGQISTVASDLTDYSPGSLSLDTGGNLLAASTEGYVDQVNWQATSGTDGNFISAGSANGADCEIAVGLEGVAYYAEGDLTDVLADYFGQAECNNAVSEVDVTADFAHDMTHVSSIINGCTEDANPPCLGGSYGTAVPYACAGAGCAGTYSVIGNIAITLLSGDSWSTLPSGDSETYSCELGGDDDRTLSCTIVAPDVEVSATD